MMATISTLANLSVTYTNHCVRATAIVALDSAGYDARHIMALSGHKSESSIREYASFLPAAKSREMSATLASASMGKPVAPQYMLAGPSQPLALAAPMAPGPSAQPLALPAPRAPLDLVTIPERLALPPLEPHLSPLLSPTQYEDALATLDDAPPNAPGTSGDLGIFGNMNWSFRNQMDVSLPITLTYYLFMLASQLTYSTCNLINMCLIFIHCSAV